MAMGVADGMNKDKIINVLGWCCAALIGWGASQLTVVGTIAQHETRIGDLATRQSEEVENRKTDIVLIQQNISDDRAHVDKSVTELIAHLDTVISQNTSLMAELKSQRREP